MPPKFSILDSDDNSYIRPRKRDREQEEIDRDKERQESKRLRRQNTVEKVASYIPEQENPPENSISIQPDPSRTSLITSFFLKQFSSRVEQGNNNFIPGET